MRRFLNLWQWTGTVDRGWYALVGFVGVAIKYNLDRFLAQVIFDRQWRPSFYLFPGESLRLNSPADERFCLTMLAVALPFIYVGVVQTLRRLR
jgi:hypothetical protein